MKYIVLFIFSSAIALYSTSGSCESPPTKAPEHRFDVVGNTMWTELGEGQRMILSYAHQTSPRWTIGASGRYQRRVFDQLALSDLSLSIPVAYQSVSAFGLSTQVDFTPLAEISPHYAFEVTPHYLIRRAWKLALCYRYAHYTSGDTHLLQPHFTFFGSYWSAAIHLYFVFPTFGPNSLTPQLRFSYAIARGWELGLWTTYGYETLNERFFNPARQAPRWENLIRVTRFLSDHEGINLNVSSVLFFPATEATALEIFNRDRTEATLHYFIKF